MRRAACCWRHRVRPLLFASCLLASALHPFDATASSNGNCPAPATCTAPSLPYSRVMDVGSRTQWGDSGGFCGSLSIQAIALSHGAWISQGVVRRNAAPGNANAHGSAAVGFEILHTNIQGALTNLSLSHEAFANEKFKVPMTQAYFTWLKAQLVQGNPVVWLIMCAGDDHTGGGTFPAGNSANYDHIEPVWGILSNHPLNDTTPYDDDVLVHGADYGAKGSTPGPSLYRTFKSLPDNKAMKGNCGAAIPEYGKNEFYPCVPSDGNDWGYAITGLSPSRAGKTSSSSLTLSLDVGRFDEPDMNKIWSRPADLTGHVTVRGSDVVKGRSYTIRRWDTVKGFAEQTAPDHSHLVTATSPGKLVWTDPNTFKSDGVAYYLATAEALVSVSPM